MSTLFHKDLGRLDFAAALSLQEELVRMKQDKEATDILLMLEHPHVYTLGRGGKEANVLTPGDVPVIRTGRGGDVTYHGPGQLVVYPLIDLRSKLRRDVHRYLRNLESVAIRTLRDFGLAGTRMPPWTGVWIEKRKIASIGVAVKRGITYHGLALNVNTDLAYFQRIIPCGLTWAEMTSMARELGANWNLAEVRERFLHDFVEIFGYDAVTEDFEDCDRRIISTNNPTIGTTETL
jgi:lipoate-protein ligase B